MFKNISGSFAASNDKMKTDVSRRMHFVGKSVMIVHVAKERVPFWAVLTAPPSLAMYGPSLHVLETV